MYYLCSETKTLISCAATVQLICAFVFAYARGRFSHDAAHIKLDYRNDPKFWDRQVWANSEDPDQTAPRGAV